MCDFIVTCWVVKKEPKRIGKYLHLIRTRLASQYCPFVPRIFVVKLSRELAVSTLEKKIWYIREKHSVGNATKAEVKGPTYSLISKE